MNPRPGLLVLLLVALAGGCVAPDDDRPPDIRVVVIETNLPNELQRTCRYLYEYPEEHAPRPCSEFDAPPKVCSEVALCAPQVDAIFDAFLACEQPEGEVDPDGLPRCP